MGGGDLNLKKSWHPSTLRNIERVWKAEQKHEAEQQKIEQLQKELAEERAREEIQTFAEDQGVVKKKEEKLDWMYQGPAAMVDRNEYLLGRKIDKTFETLQQVESGKATEEDVSDVTMFSSQNLSGNVTVDLAAKIREDPLFNIMKKEKEQRKNLLTNPVKMKQLQQLLKASLTEKSSKKSKKSKKKKHQESDFDEAPKKRKKHKKHNYSDSEDEQKSYPKESKKSLKIKHHRDISPDERFSKYNDAHELDSNQHSSSSSSSNKELNYRPMYNNASSSQKDYHSRNNHQNYGYSERCESYSKDFSSQNHSRVAAHKEPYKDHISQTSNYKSHSDFSHRENKFSKAPKRQLDAKERDRLLKEMQENAKWREEQRKKNTIRYREEDEREDKIKRVDSSDFLKPMLSKVASKGSLENRVKQKIFSIQRSGAAMDKNFARRE